MILFSGLWIQQDYSLSCSAFYYLGHGWLNLRQATKDLINKACYFGLGAMLTWLQSTQLAHVWLGLCSAGQSSLSTTAAAWVPIQSVPFPAGEVGTKDWEGCWFWCGEGSARGEGHAATAAFFPSGTFHPAALCPCRPQGRSSTIHTADGQGLPVLGKAGFAGT